MTPRQDPPTHPQAAIPRRAVDFGFDPQAVPRNWCGDDTFTTTLVAGLSMVFPVGERFFVESVKQLRHRVDSPELRAQIVGFIGQESMHGREHRAFNDLLAASGYSAAPRIEARVGWVLRLVRRIFSPSSQLAATSALEHFTAILAEQLLTDERLQGEFHESVRSLWLWHALEESEHKAVAFDVYRAAGGGEVRRMLIMLLATVLFFAIMGVIQLRLLAQRGELHRPWRWLRGLTRFWISPGYFTRLFPAYLAYYRPGFHPDDRDTRALVASWRDRLFGTSGTLRDRVRVIETAA